jgi:hypothetical protein
MAEIVVNWFRLTLQLMLVPVTASRTSNRLTVIARLVPRHHYKVALRPCCGLAAAAVGSDLGGAVAGHPRAAGGRASGVCPPRFAQFKDGQADLRLSAHVRSCGEV